MRKEEQKNPYGENHTRGNADGIDRKVEQDTASENPEPQRKQGRFEKADQDKVETPRD